jgi:adenosylcobinamide-phosphate guanylyltransferase
MCGGKGTRLKKTLGLDVEKPLIKIKNKPLIEYLIDTLIQSNEFYGIFAAVSNNTKRTREFIKSNYKNKITIIETLGKDYSEDYLKIINYFKEIQNEKTHVITKIMFLPIDLPLISLEMLTQLITINQVKPCLTIIIEKRFVKDVGILPSPYEFTVDKKICCYSGISIIDAKNIDMNINNPEKPTLIDEEYKILNHVEIACNANTLEDLKIAEKFLIDGAAN